jgi:type II restriction enzyme
LIWLEPGHPASDYSCPHCGFWYQLKSQRAPIRDTITDGAYGAMMAAIQKDEAPSFYFMQYDLAAWSVRNLLLVPHFAFPPSAIIKRKPLSVTARRAGWIGCNFALNRIPAEARIWLVTTTAQSREGETPALL